MAPDGVTDATLAQILDEARRIGLLGPGPIDEHLAHAALFVDAIPRTARFFVDLGSGGGLPGLVVACARGDLHGALLDGSTRRGAFLQRAVETLGVADRIRVWIDRAETVGRDPTRRGTADVVVARGFGPPPVVAECAAPLLRTGGRLIVSDPPDPAVQAARWPDSGVGIVGLTITRQEAGPPAFTVLEQHTPCPERYPRRVGVPAKRPLF